MANNASTAEQPGRTLGEHDPIEIQCLQDVAPWWPFGTHTTYRLVRRGDLRAIAIGRRRYATLALLREFLSRHTAGVPA